MEEQHFANQLPLGILKDDLLGMTPIGRALLPETGREGQ
jgi:hypothetical protein